MPDTDLRNRLRSSIASIRQAEQNLTSLQEGQDRAHSQLREAERRLSDAREELANASRGERSRLAYAYVEGADLDGPVASAQADVNTAQAEVDKLEKVESALAGEIDRVQANLGQRHNVKYVAMAEIVASSPAYQCLIEQHRIAWFQLRTVKEALRIVAASLHGYAPKALMDEPARSEPLAADRIGYPIDNGFVGEWRDSLAALEHDADAKLPHFAETELRRAPSC